MLRLFDLRPDERRATAFAALCHFFVLFSWYLIRPLREALGIRGGADELPYLMIGTVVVAALVNPLIGRVLDRRARIDAMRLLYRAVQVLLLGFWVAFQFVEGERETWLGYAFFVAASVLNLLIVSIFWSVSNEAFSRETAQRAFGPGPCSRPRCAARARCPARSSARAECAPRA